MVTEKLPDDAEGPVRAAIQAVDKDALFEGEDPGSHLAEDAEHWVSVYSELIQYKRSLMATSEEEVAELEHPESQGEANNVDGVILATELERFRRRLAFWLARLEVLRSSEAP
jgi:hypothetical protein